MLIERVSFQHATSTYSYPQQNLSLVPCKRNLSIPDKLVLVPYCKNSPVGNQKKAEAPEAKYRIAVPIPSIDTIYHIKFIRHDTVQ